MYNFPEIFAQFIPRVNSNLPVMNFILSSTSRVSGSILKGSGPVPSKCIPMAIGACCALSNTSQA
tara:strand:- start:438 stop:632 length:195 start_codon:yes stop_codon:yes gene_type:complete